MNTKPHLNPKAHNDAYDPEIVMVSIPEPHLALPSYHQPALSEDLWGASNSSQHHKTEPAHQHGHHKYPHRLNSDHQHDALRHTEGHSHCEHGAHDHSHDTPKGWCPTCAQAVPLLSDVQIQELAALYAYVEATLRAFKTATNDRLNYVKEPASYAQVAEAYVDMVGGDIDLSLLPLKGKALATHLLTHSQASMGPECDNCGSHLSSEKASFCGACGTLQDVPLNG